MVLDAMLASKATLAFQG